jgi:NAD(P)-dependent dehydrogenase (short-subunit alcohol dehydrogenase family)
MDETASAAKTDLSSAPLERLSSLDGRSAVVTGGGAGIGAAIGRRLAEAGAAVILGDIALRPAERVAEEITEAGGAAHAIALDATDEAAVEGIAAEAVARHGTLDIWVNNVGIYPRGSILEIEPEEWDQVMAVNVRSAYLGSRAAARRMVAQGSGGVIATITSDASFNASGGTNGAHYVASKHALAGLTKSMAVQLAQYGIRAIAVAPTLTRTPGIEADREHGDAEILDAFASHVPAGRVGEADDIARAVAFAVSDQASFVSGSTIVVDGGMLAL